MCDYPRSPLPNLGKKYFFVLFHAGTSLAGPPLVVSNPSSLPQPSNPVPPGNASGSAPVQDPRSLEEILRPESERQWAEMRQREHQQLMAIMNRDPRESGYDADASGAAGSGGASESASRMDGRTLQQEQLQAAIRSHRVPGTNCSQVQ